MRSSPAFFLPLLAVALGTAFAQPTPPAKGVDTDVDSQLYNGSPLDSATKPESAPVSPAKTAQQGNQAADNGSSQNAKAQQPPLQDVNEQSKVAPDKENSTSTVAKTNATTAVESGCKAVSVQPVVPPAPRLAIPAMPPLPETAQARVTQTGGMDYSFTNTPLIEVLRQIGRQLDRPLQVSVRRNFKVSGEWKMAKASDVLHDIASRCGLVVRESGNAYTVDDNGVEITVGEAVATHPKHIVTATPLSKALEPSIVQTTPKSEKERQKALKKNESEFKKAAARRAELEAKIQPN